VDIETRRKKQQALMTELLERKIRLHAQDLYDRRGESEGSELGDWVQAESQVLEKTTLAPLYRKAKAIGREFDEFEHDSNAPLPSAEPCCSEVGTKPARL
jgi:hypothetical protein